ncbi:hypothetical protein DFR86_03875 [Acidianus sulfidivorans JP7]|uniref:Uncharacterized protein n=1 Tax=Acidianus sulfidivorans JP7 TaxID=619593 RepID=A0A2U9IL55_9CREN|nr:hypothetical protein [Acidianus sulfidivorans]AWR96778.1 hypothetical protein DFR86_03875 [Acidianus sulfidivorans JP7]
MNKIYFIIPIILLIIGLIPFFFVHLHGPNNSEVCIIGTPKVGYSYIPIESEFHVNASEYINITIKETGNQAEAICYIRQDGNTIPGFNVTVIVNGSRDYGSSIPPGINNITLLLTGYTLENTTAYMYLENGQNIELNL